MKRDIAGLLLLLVMPAILIIVMALVQDAPFRDYQVMKFDLLVSDNDNGTMAHQIKDGLKQSKNFHVIDSLDGKPINDEQLKALLQKGNYKIGVVIPKGITAEMVNSANTIANTLSKKMGLGTTLPAREIRSNYVRIYFDPVTKPTFRTSIIFALDKYVTYASSNMLVQRLSMLSKDADTSGVNNDDLKKVMQGIGLKEEALDGPNNLAKYTVINSVQHNVPAWAIFGVFFIVVSISGHMIREREEGSGVRLELIPSVHAHVAVGKILLYTLVCVVQFALMFCVGLWVVPLFNLPALYLGLHYTLLLPMAIAIGLAATSYGYFLGSFFKTATQAVPFGAISIVIFSAIGGIWVPVELLSHTMQQAAQASPLHWSLEGVENIIIRNGDMYTIFRPVLYLISFSIALLIISIFRNSRRYHSIQ